MFNIPPAGFRPLTASASQLREYNLPTRHMLRGRWTRIMRKLHLVTPPRFLVMLGSIKFQKLTNWAGNVADGFSNYTYVHASWTEPSIFTSQCSTTSESTWVGLSHSSTSSPLAQDGTAYGENGAGISAHQSWYEILPAGPVPVNVTATKGDSFDASTQHTTRNGHAGYVFTLINDHTGASASPFVQSSSYSGNNADVITERPTEGGGLTDLSNFRSFEINEADAEHGGADNFMGALPHFGVYMYDSQNREMAHPGSISSNGESWSMNQDLCD